MQLQSETLENGILLISLSGRFDIAGSREIETPFAMLTTTKKQSIVVDLAGVNFLASIGIRALLANARGQSGRGGKLVLCNVQAPVRGVLDTAGITGLIPVFDDRPAAELALAGSL